MQNSRKSKIPHITCDEQVALNVADVFTGPLEKYMKEASDWY